MDHSGFHWDPERGACIGLAEQTVWDSFVKVKHPQMPEVSLADYLFF